VLQGLPDSQPDIVVVPIPEIRTYHCKALNLGPTEEHLATSITAFLTEHYSRTPLACRGATVPGDTLFESVLLQLDQKVVPKRYTAHELKWLLIDWLYTNRGNLEVTLSFTFIPLFYQKYHKLSSTVSFNLLKLALVFLACVEV
jgi:hypothetical protein